MSKSHCSCASGTGQRCSAGDDLLTLGSGADALTFSVIGALGTLKVHPSPVLEGPLHTVFVFRGVIGKPLPKHGLPRGYFESGDGDQCGAQGFFPTPSGRNMR